MGLMTVGWDALSFSKISLRQGEAVVAAPAPTTIEMRKAMNWSSSWRLKSSPTTSTKRLETP
jgi:hypothetical protein